MSHKIYTNEAGNPVPSVTTVLSVISKPGLYAWYAKHGWQECKRITDESLEIGTALHSYINDFFTGAQTIGIEGNTKLGNSAKNFHRFVEKFNPKPVRIESEFINEEYQYGGTADAVLQIKNNLVLLDWKTSTDIFPENILQLHAYAKGINLQSKHLWVVRLSKQDDIDFKKDILKLEFNDIYFKGFLGALDLYNSLKYSKNDLTKLVKKSKINRKGEI